MGLPSSRLAAGMHELQLILGHGLQGIGGRPEQFARIVDLGIFFNIYAQGLIESHAQISVDIENGNSIFDGGADLFIRHAGRAMHDQRNFYHLSDSFDPFDIHVLLQGA